MIAGRQVALVVLVIITPVSACFAAAKEIKPVPKPVEVPPSAIHALLIETTRFIRADQARQNFDVDGNGLTAAVLDTGLRVTHKDFANTPDRIPTVHNFSGGADQNVADGNGHGTNVAGIIGANSLH